MKRLFSAAALILCVILLAGAVPVHASSETPYQTFDTDKWGNTVASPSHYIPTMSVTGDQLGCGTFTDAADLFYSPARHEIYVADAGNKRIVVLSEDIRYLREITSLTSDDGSQYTFGNPQGLFVKDDGTIYIADQGNQQVVAASAEGKLLEILPTPESSLLPENFNYQPTKIVVDVEGRAYILSTGIYQGLIYLDADGSFLKFFGPNDVEMTFQRQIMKLWKSILSDKAAATMQSFNPIEYSNVFLAEDGYIYATAAGSENGSKLATKLNPVGIDCLPFTMMADYLFSDVSVDADGIITFLDTTRGRLWQIDPNGNSLGFFGGAGDQVGLFKKAVSLVEVNRKLYVLDADKDSITEFALTEFGAKVRTALRLYNEGLYTESVEPWKELIRQDANYLLAYIGLGKAYYQMKDYETAMYYFRLANARSLYSTAFREASLNRMRSSFGYIVLAVVLVIAAWIVFKVLRNRPAPLRRRKKGKEGASHDEG